MTEDDRHNELRKSRAIWYRTLSIGLIGLGVFQNLFGEPNWWIAVVTLTGGFGLKFASERELKNMRVNHDA